MTNAEGITKQLRESISLLAAPADQQTTHLRKLSNVGVDELGLEFDDVAGAALALRGIEELDPELSEVVLALDKQLSAMSGENNASLWTLQALGDAPEWERVRELATKALRHMDMRSSTE